MTNIRCHDAEVRPGREPGWRPPAGRHAYRGAGVSRPGRPTRWSKCDVCGRREGNRVHGLPWRTCSWCGSIHPEDLLNRPEPSMMKEIHIAGAHLVDVPNVEWADMKYGWPHKLYLDFGPGLNAKFYSRHLADHPGLIEPFNERFGYLGVRFGINERGLYYRMGVMS